MVDPFDRVYKASNETEKKGDVNLSSRDSDTVWKLLREGCAEFLKPFQYLNILMIFGQILTKPATTFLFSTQLKINKQTFHMII